MKKFTLLELLIIMAIIGILITILMPSLRTARKSALSAVCMSNLNQLGTASIRFALEHNRKLPSNGGVGNLPYTNSQWWTKSLNSGGYLQWSEDAMTCPSLPYEGDWTSQNWVTYGAPKYMDRTGNRVGEISTPYFGFEISQVESPSEFFWYADSATGSTGDLYQWQTYEYQYKKGRGSALKIHTRHNEKANLWFADGHVSSNGIGSLVKLGVEFVWLENLTAGNNIN